MMEIQVRMMALEAFFCVRMEILAMGWTTVDEISKCLYKHLLLLSVMYRHEKFEVRSELDKSEEQWELEKGCNERGTGY
jgi:hypothetical protein